MSLLNRRHFISAGLASAALSQIPKRVKATNPATSSAEISSENMLIRDCSIPGETRADDAFPAHPNGLQLSRNRFLLIYATRGWRGVDDDLSIIYQIRNDSYTGLVLKEGVFAQADDEWDVWDDGNLYKMSHGAPAVFGVPQGALIEGRPASHANVFVAKWYKYAREFSAPGQLRNGGETTGLTRKTLHVEWVQFRLNATETDIEILQPKSQLRPPESDPAPFSLRYTQINQSYVSPLPLNDSATEWVDVHSLYHYGSDFDTGFGFPGSPAIVATRFKFDSHSSLYQWVESSQPLFDPQYMTYESCPVRLPDGDWAIAGRRKKHPVIWYRSSDLFGRKPGRVYAGDPATHPLVNAPITAYGCADGKVRLLTGDFQTSPYHVSRDPLYCWHIDPAKDFFQTRRQIVFSGREMLPKVRPETYLMADMAKVLPHAGGPTQTILHRVRTRSINQTTPGKGPALLPYEKSVQGIYHATLTLDTNQPGLWEIPLSSSSTDNRTASHL